MAVNHIIVIIYLGLHNLARAWGRAPVYLLF